MRKRREGELAGGVARGPQAEVAPRVRQHQLRLRNEANRKPGIGVDINEEAMRRFATPGVPFFV